MTTTEIYDMINSQLNKFGWDLKEFEHEIVDFPCAISGIVISPSGNMQAFKIGVLDLTEKSIQTLLDRLIYELLGFR